MIFYLLSLSNEWHHTRGVLTAYVRNEGPYLSFYYYWNLLYSVITHRRLLSRPLENISEKIMFHFSSLSNLWHHTRGVLAYTNSEGSN